MQLSNIRRIELEALSLAVFLHLVAMVIYGITIGHPGAPHFSSPVVKINLSGITSSPAQLPVKVVEAKTAATAGEADAGTGTAPDYLQLLQQIVRQKSNIPSGAKAGGKAVLRLEFDRSGHIKNYSLKTSTGNKMLDAAALQVGAALTKNPFPAVPASFYPDQKLLKFDFGIDYGTANQ